jgi:hypothetical protein
VLIFINIYIFLTISCFHWTKRRFSSFKVLCEIYENFQMHNDSLFDHRFLKTLKFLSTFCFVHDMIGNTQCSQIHDCILNQFKDDNTYRTSIFCLTFLSCLLSRLVLVYLIRKQKLHRLKVKISVIECFEK